MSTTDNGWPASPSLTLRPFVINGTAFVPGIADNDDVEDVLRYVLQRVADEVERPVNPGCWGFAFRENRNDPNALSRHSGGIAVDFNAPAHPNGVPTGATFSFDEIGKIRRILDDLDVLCGAPAGERVVRWGGDFNGTPDAMHFEVNVTPAQLRIFAARLRNQQEALMVTPEDEVKVRQIVDKALADSIPTIAAATAKAILNSTVNGAGTKVKAVLEQSWRAGRKILS